MPRNSSLALAALAVVLAGCGVASTPTAAAPATTSPIATTAVTETASATSSPVARSAPTMRFLSEPQAGIAPWLTAIQSAQHRIEVNEYLLTDSSLIAALRQAAQRGVTVDVIIDGKPYGDNSAVATTRAAFAGSKVQLHLAPTRFTGSWQYDHAKYLVVDAGTAHALAIVGSPNGTASAFDGANLEDAIETSAPAITKALTAVFHADWTNTRAGVGPRKSLVLSPGSQAALVRLLQSKGPVEVMTEELGDAGALYQALDAHGSGARVLVPASLSAEDQSYAAALQQKGVQVRTLSAPYVHAKLVLTPTETFVGSQNFSIVSLNDNREVGLITSAANIHRQALAWFNAEWVHATPWQPPSSTSPAPISRGSGSESLPYIPKGDTPAQVERLWGKPSSISSDTYQGVPETVWHYAGGTVYFEHGVVTYVKRR